MKIWFIYTFLLTFGLWFRSSGQSVDENQAFTIRGGLSARGIYYHADGAAARMRPFTYMVSGNLTVSAYGTEIPVSFIFSSQNRDFRQSFNQFGLSPTFRKWLTVHAGYRSVQFSPFTLGGHTLLGGGVEGKPGKLRFGLLAGRLNRATALDTNTAVLAPVAFTRSAIAGKLGFGDGDNFIDLHVLRAEDAPSSLRIPLETLYASRFSFVFPAQNLATGLTFRRKFWNQALLAEADAAVSVFTHDINSPLVAESNGFAEKTVRRLIFVNGTTKFYKALQASLRYQGKGFALKAQYRRIDPEYRSMGAYFFNNDVENITLNPSAAFWKGRIRLNASAGIQRDNLLKQKLTTARRFIGSLILGADLTDRLGIDVNFINYNINQQPQTTRFADTLRITQTTRNLSVTPRYLIAGTQLTHLFMVMANYSELSDFNKLYSEEQQSRGLTTGNYQLSWAITFNEHNLTLNTGASYSSLKNQVLTDNNYGASLGVNAGFGKGKGTAGLNGGYLLNTRNQEKGHILNASLMTSFKVSRHHTLQMNAYYTSNIPKVAGSSVFTHYAETRGELAWQYTF